MFPDVFRHDRRGTAVWDEIVDEIGIEPLIEDFDDTPEGMAEFDKANDGYRRAISKTQAFRNLQMKELSEDKELQPNRKSIYWINFLSSHVIFRM